METRTRRDITRLVEDRLGLRVVDLKDTSKGHVKCIVESRTGKKVIYIFSGTTSDHRSMLNAEKLIARLAKGE